jgi:hypothetical protein
MQCGDLRFNRNLMDQKHGVSGHDRKSIKITDIKFEL